MLTAYIITNIAWLLVWQYFAWRTIRLRLRDVIADTLPYMTITAAVMAIACLAASAVNNTLLSLLIKITVAAGLYLLTMKISGSAILSETITYLKKKNK